MAKRSTRDGELAKGKLRKGLSGQGAENECSVVQRECGHQLFTRDVDEQGLFVFYKCTRESIHCVLFVCGTVQARRERT